MSICVKDEPDRAGHAARPFRGRWWLLPLLAGLLAHLPVLSAGFVWDDIKLIAQHPEIDRPGFLSDLFSRDYGLEFGQRQACGYYRPIFMLLVTLLHRLAGPSPLVFHAFSLAVFLCTVLLLVHVCRRLLPAAPAWLPTAAGLLYALHPARTEVAAFTMSLPDLLLDLGGLALLLLLLRRPARRNPLRRMSGLVALTLLLGLTKESAFLTIAALAAVALLLGAADRARRPDWLVGAAGLILGAALAVGARVLAGIQPAPVMPALRLALGSGSGAAWEATGFALRDLLIPRPAVFFSWTEPAGHPWQAVALAAVAVVVAGTIALLGSRKKAELAFAVAWASAGMLNVALVRANALPYSQRYLAVAPAVLVLAGFAAWFAGRRRGVGTSDDAAARTKRLCALSGAAYLALAGVFTLSSSLACQSPRAFFGAMAEQNPEAIYPRLALAEICLYDYGDFDGAEGYAREAIARRPDVPRVREMGKLLAKRRIYERRPAEALMWVDWAGSVLTNDAEVWHLRGVACHQLGDATNAMHCLRRAGALDPANADYPRLLTQWSESAADRGKDRSP